MNMSRSKGAIAILIGLGASWFAPAQTKLPEGKGKAEFERICSNCHDVSTATGERRTRDEWAGVVDDMQGRGAVGTDEEMKLIIDYLTQNFGKEEKK